MFCFGEGIERSTKRGRARDEMKNLATFTFSTFFNQKTPFFPLPPAFHPVFGIGSVIFTLVIV